MIYRSYRKLRKFVESPRQYLRDVRLKKQIPNLHEVRQSLLAAHVAADSGEPDLAWSLLEGVPPQLAQKWSLEAKLALYAGDYERSERAASHAMQLLSPDSKEFRTAFYMFHEALRFQSKFDQSLASLTDLPFEDSGARYFAALRLGCLGARDVGTYERVLLKMQPEHERAWLRARNHHLLLLRDLGRFECALQEAALLLSQVTSSPSGALRTARPRSGRAARQWRTKAATALQQLQIDLGACGVDFFLISGTLLGCVREGDILGHDTDLDVGVLPAVSMQTIRQAVENSARFKYQEVKSENTVYLVHLNGVKIDVFRHFDSDGRLCHEGIKSRWWNTPFELTPMSFLGQEYFVPADHDLYLTENYGDWRTPVTDFETFIDTPNMEVTNSPAMALYFSSRAIAAYKMGDVERFIKCYEQFCLQKNKSIPSPKSRVIANQTTQAVRNQ